MADKVLHIITTKEEYVCKWPEKKPIIGTIDGQAIGQEETIKLQGEGTIRIDRDVCRLRIGLNKRGGRNILLEPLAQDPAYRPWVDIYPKHIIAVMELDQNGPFYKQYVQTTSSLVLPGGPGTRISQN